MRNINCLLLLFAILLMGYATEVTIQITDASTQTLIAVTTAEGKGASEADNVRVAIINALTPLVRE